MCARRLLLSTWVVGSFALLLSCGGRSGRNGDGSPPEQSEPELTAEAACRELAETACKKRELCDLSADATRRYTSEAQCRERTELACRGFFAMPDTAQTPEAVMGCAREIDGTECSRAETLFYSADSRLPWCIDGGRRSNGETCVSDAQCQSTTCAVEGRCGKCRAQYDWVATLRYEGESCGVGSSCVATVECESGVCVRSACSEPGCRDYGRTCSAFDDTPRYCERGSACMNMSDRGTGQCLAYAADGEACKHWTGPPCLYPARCIDDVCRPEHELTCD